MEATRRTARPDAVQGGVLLEDKGDHIERTERAIRNAALVSMCKLMLWYANLYASRRELPVGVDADDVLQDACVQFIVGYEPARCGVPNAYAKIAVRAAYFQTLRRSARRSAPVSMESTSMEEIVAPVPVQDCASAAELDRLHAALDRLPLATRQLLADRFGLGGDPKPLRELAGGLSRQAVHARVKSGVKKLRTSFNQLGECP